MTAREISHHPEGYTSYLDTFDDGSQLQTDIWPGQVNVRARDAEGDGWCPFVVTRIECVA